VLIDDLPTGCLMHKFVDDSTLSEIIGKDGVSQMETNFGDVLNWSALNLMNINVTQTKEMIVGANGNPPPQLNFNDEIIGKVFFYKLLGVMLPGGGHSCIDCLLSMRILLPRTNTRENNLTSFIIFCRGNLLRAKLWTVIQCPGHDGKLQPYRVNMLPYRVWNLACWW